MALEMSLQISTIPLVRAHCCVYGTKGPVGRSALPYRKHLAFCTRIAADKPSPSRHIPDQVNRSEAALSVAAATFSFHNKSL
jgi:hypothetical protein